MLHLILKIKNRSKILVVSSIIGIVFNILLGILKIILFLFTGSVSILVDSINNLTDSISSFVTLIGTKLSEKPGDKNHPNGHGRIEYISALIISLIVFIVGIQFFRVSIDRIFNKRVLNFNSISLIIMFISVLVKIYMFYLFSALSKKINSLPLRAQSKDYLGDSIITSVILISMFIYKFFDIHLDGYIGLVVSLFIMYSGFNLIMSALSEIIGRVPDDFMKNLEKKIQSYNGILGVHDIVFASFGEEKLYATAHVEMDYRTSLLAAHRIIDNIEYDIKKDFGCIISIHVEPVGKYSEKELLAKKFLDDYLRKDQRIKSYHDLSYNTNSFRVDLFVYADMINNKELEILKCNLEHELEKILECKCEITMDKYF